MPNAEERRIKQTSEIGIFCCQSNRFQCIKDIAVCTRCAPLTPQPIELTKEFLRGNPALDASAVIEIPTFNRTDFSAAETAESEAVSRSPQMREMSGADSQFELGLWLSGLESFSNIRNHSLAEESRAKAATRDWTREFRLTHRTLLLCSRLAYKIEKSPENEFENSRAPQKNTQTNRAEINELSLALKDVVLINEGLLRAASPLGFGEWTAWSSLLTRRFGETQIIRRFIEQAERTGENFLPENFKKLLGGKNLSTAMRTDLNLVLPRFAKILKWLSVVERMLEKDEPLKPALLIFARIYEQIQELVKYVDNRLLRFSNEEDALFGALDGTAYTASIELRKVYNYELAGVAELRSSPAIFARIETAHSLLTDSFQQTLVNFAQLIEPNVEPTEIFPNFQIKLRQSLALRKNLREMQTSVQACEQNPEKSALESLHNHLNEFLETQLHFLFYKDTETMERFIEEVLITTDKKDLVPILHRFGAYIETLFGQINMRTVLAKHPFEK